MKVSLLMDSSKKFKFLKYDLSSLFSYYDLNVL